MRLTRTFFVALAAIFALSACRSLAGADPRSDLPFAEPSAAGMDAGLLGRIAPRMREFVAEKQMAGSVTLLVRRGAIVHCEVVGFADLENMSPMRRGTIFAIASMTKPITATGVMILQDEGKLSVDDQVSKYIQQFKAAKLKTGPPKREITIRDLLTHTSGVGGDQQNRGSLKETVELIAEQPLQFEPGSQWRYSPGLTVCGRIIEVASGLPYDEFLQQRIFGPLHMADTTFFPSPEQQKRLARLYKPGEGEKTIEPTSHWLSDLSPQRTPNPSGGLFSTALDMARFYQMVLNGGQLGGRRIVSQSAVKQMTTLQTSEQLTTGFTPGNGWGLGWGIVREPQGVTSMLSPGTYGHGGAFGTQGWVDPAREMIFVLMIQRTGFGNGDASDIRRDFQQLAVEAICD